MTDSEQTPETEPAPEPVPETEWSAPDIVPEEGETYMAAYERMLREAAGITAPEPETTEESEVLGVLTGQVPMRSMPIAMDAPEPEEDTSE